MVTGEASPAVVDWIREHMTMGTAFAFLDEATFRHPSLHWLDEGRPRIVPCVGSHAIALPGMSLEARPLPPLLLRALQADCTVYCLNDPIHLLVIDLGRANQSCSLRLQGERGEERPLSAVLGPQGGAVLALRDLPVGAWKVEWPWTSDEPPQPPCSFRVVEDVHDALLAPGPAQEPEPQTSLLTSLARHDILGSPALPHEPRSVRGISLSTGTRGHDWPLEIERVDTTHARLHATREVEHACAVVFDPLQRPPATTGLPLVLRDLARGQVAEVEVPSPVGLLMVGASSTSAPMLDGTAVTLGPESMACRVAITRLPTAGEPLDVVVHARGLQVGEATAHLVVKDIRAASGPSPSTQLTRAILAFASSHGLHTHVPRRLLPSPAPHAGCALPDDVEEFAVAQGLLSQRQRERVRAESMAGGDDFLGAALRLSLLTEEDWGRALATWSGVPFFDLDREAIDTRTASLLDPALATQLQALAVHREEGRLFVAMVNPCDPDTTRCIAEHTGLTVVPLLATEPALERALARRHNAHRSHGTGSQAGPQPGGPSSPPPPPQPSLPHRVLYAGLLPLAGGIGRATIVLPHEVATYRADAFVFCERDWCEATTTFTASP